MNAINLGYRPQFIFKINFYRGYEHGKPRIRYRFHRDRR